MKDEYRWICLECNRECIIKKKPEDNECMLKYSKNWYRTLPIWRQIIIKEEQLICSMTGDPMDFIKKGKLNNAQTKE